MNKKQIIIDYEEYLELKKVYDLFEDIKHKGSIGYNYPPNVDKNTQYIYNTELLEFLNSKRFSGDLERIVIEKGE